MKTGTIIQARMSSKRLPGKVLREVSGNPLLQYLWERLKRCKELDFLIVATSIENSDDPIAQFCNDQNIQYYRGDLKNVASRFSEIAKIYDLDAFVRVSGDSPLLDTSLVEKAIQIFNSTSSDLVTNVMPRTFPSGQSVEVLRVKTFQLAYQKMKHEEDLEHVTRYIYRNPEKFKIENFASKKDFGECHLSVDTALDVEKFILFTSQMERPHWEYTWKELLAFDFKS